LLVPEVDVSGVSMFEKMQFSMYTPEVAAALNEKQITSVVLFGIEVCVRAELAPVF
jgi:hypothetical protein